MLVCSRNGALINTVCRIQITDGNFRHPKSLKIYEQCFLDIRFNPLNAKIELELLLCT